MDLYHGTSYENYSDLIDYLYKNYLPKQKKNWSCSADGKLYLYGLDHCAENRSIDQFCNAYDSACLCAAIKDSRSSSVVVVQFTINDDDIKELLLPDHTDDFGGLMNNRLSINTELLKANLDRIKVEAFFCTYYYEKRWMYLYNLYHSTCGLNYELARFQMINQREVEEKCDEWYEKNKEYEWHFRDEIPQDPIIEDSTLYSVAKKTYAPPTLSFGSNMELYLKNPVPGRGEIVYDNTVKKIKVGDGVTTWRYLDYVEGIDVELQKEEGAE